MAYAAYELTLMKELDYSFSSNVLIRIFSAYNFAALVYSTDITGISFLGTYFG